MFKRHGALLVSIGFALLVGPLDIFLLVAIPADLFDSVIDNLLENAYVKRRAESGIEITVTLQSEMRSVCLRVCDQGSAPLLQPEPMNFLSSPYYHIVDWVSDFTKPVSKRHSLDIRLP